MTKKLVRHGNSTAVILDKPLLDLLNVDIDTPLEIRTDGKSIIISPQEHVSAEEDVLQALEKVNKNHKSTLKKLAE